MILDDVERHARERPGERAVVEVGADGTVRELTWASSSATPTGSRRRCCELGVRPGEPVAFQLPNRLEFVTIALGHAAGRRGVRAADADLPRARAVVHARREPRTRAVRPGHVPRPRPRGDGGRGPAGVARARARRRARRAATTTLLDGTDRAASPALERDQLAQLLFTSGTSGEPKGALHRHDVLMRAADHHIAHFGLGAEDVVYVPSPLAHQTGFLYGMWIALRLGVPQVLQEAWDPEVGLDAMRRFGVTFVQAATPFLADLTRVAEDRGRTTRASDAPSWPPAPPSPASSPAARARCSAPRSAAPGAPPRAAWAARSRPATRPTAPGAPTAARWPTSSCASSTTPAPDSPPAGRATSRSTPTACSRAT